VDLESIKIIWVITTISLFPITIWYFLAFKKVTSQLESKHYETWESLGKIGIIKNNSIANSNKVILFFLKKEYYMLKDKELNNDANLCRKLLIIGFVLSLTAFIIPIVIGKYG